MSDALFQRLAGYGTATLDEAQGRIGALPAAIKPLHPGMRLCGPAYCVRTVPGHNLMLHRAIYAAPRGAVLVVDVGGEAGHEFGYWGDIMTCAAQQRGLAGLVIDGGVRDLAEIEASGFPVFARMHAIRGTEKRDAGEHGGRITLGRVSIATGDMIVGDREGVVAIPAAGAAAVAEAAAQRVEKEAGVLRTLREGRSTLEIFGWA